MVEPDKVYDAACGIADENEAFRAYLKENADPDELDRQFHRLHEELFSSRDCCKCNNCCRIYAVALREDEAESISAFLGLSTPDFAERYLFRAAVGGYGIEGPCPFLQADGRCLIHACKPTVCKNYPPTNQPDRMGNLLHLFSLAAECPVVYEMIGRLKALYGYRPDQPGVKSHNRIV